MYPADVQFEFKVGSRVMLLKNMPLVLGGFEFVNGDTGTVRGVGTDLLGAMVQVELDRGGIVNVHRAIWSIYGFDVEAGEFEDQSHVSPKVVGQFSQFPMRLGYATTIHKSQGMTLDRVHIVLGQGTFASGHAYVAFSRCRSLDSVSLDRPLRVEDVQVAPEVIHFYENLNCAWDPQIQDTDGMIFQ